MANTYNWLKCHYCEVSIQTKVSEVICLNCNSYMYVLEGEELARGIREQKRSPPKSLSRGRKPRVKISQWPVESTTRHPKDI